MANVIKYSTSNPSQSSLRKGNLAVGIGGGNYGPTSTTGFVNGMDIPNGGYVVYLLHNNSPAAWVAYNDTDLIAVARTLGNSGTTVTSAKEYLAGRSDTWVLNNMPNNIVTDGLVLALNAGDVSSYPTTGTTWYDVSGDGNNTSIDSADFNSGGGYFQSVGDAPDSLIFSTPDSTTISNTFSVTSGGWTIEELIRIDDTTYPEAAAGTVVSGKAYGSNETGFDWQHGVMSGTSLNIDMSNLNTGGGASRDAEVNLLIDSDLQTYGQWILRSIYWDRTNDKCGVYYNGRFQDSGSISGVSGYSLYDGGGIVWGTLYGWHHDGARSLMRVYNKVLSESEVLQNYYQAPIVTDGLVFAVDAGNLVSYENGSVTSYSLTDSNGGTLTNGVGFDSANGGTWEFDGTNDYITLPSSIEDALNGGTEASLNMWVKLNSNSNSVANTGIIQLSGYNNGNGNLYWYSNGYTYLDIFTTTRYRVWINTVLDPKNWHMLTITTTPGTNGWKAYLNGILQYQTTGQSTVSVDSTIVGGLTLGENSNGRYTNGNIASCFIYDKALTSDEVLQNYNAQISRFQ